MGNSRNKLRKRSRKQIGLELIKYNRLKRHVLKDVTNIRQSDCQENNNNLIGNKECTLIESMDVSQPQPVEVENSFAAAEDIKEISQPLFIEDRTDDFTTFRVDRCNRNKKEDFNIGRRLVDLSYFFNSIKSLNSHDLLLGCDMSCLDIVSEKRKGLDSKVTIHCNLCNRDFYINLLDHSDNCDINENAISGVMSTGNGHAQLEMITASLELPSISTALYLTLQNTICDMWERVAAHCMAEAAKQEADYAISIGNIDRNGIPMITVALDGCWSKRSYRTNYSALSGAAAIVGHKFGKVLYMGVKNKYCIICSRATSKGVEIPKHNCYKNYSGSSTAMESTIVVEGFKSSISDYRLIYSHFIADGDSSTYKKILDARPYNDLVVEKIECKNHLLRNFCNALVRMTQDTKYPIELRKILKSRYMRLRRGVNGAIDFWGKQHLSNDMKVENLSKDIQNGPQHVFGNHSNCRDYYCTTETRRPESCDLLPAMEGSGLMAALVNLSRKLSYQSRSLIHNVTSNVVESFNSQVAKYVGGKRVNFSFRRSYSARCAASVVSFNTGSLHTVVNDVMKKKKNYLVSRVEKIRLKKVKNYCRKIKKIHGSVLNDTNYGTNCEKPDLSPSAYENEKNVFLNNLNLSLEARILLEQCTRLQRTSNLWISQRRKMLTSSWFGDVCKRGKSTKCAPLVKRMLYQKKLSQVPSIRYGTDNEETAKLQLQSQENIIIEDCGLFVDKDHSFLGTTPDGKYVGGIVEIKCPSSCAGMPIEDAMRKHAFWKLNKISKDFFVNKNHSWYYQIQGQLHITLQDTCILGIWLGDNQRMQVYHIKRDDEFWKQKMENQLVKFYMDCMLPELVDPRYTRGMEIREPPK